MTKREEKEDKDDQKKNEKKHDTKIRKKNEADNNKGYTVRRL